MKLTLGPADLRTLKRILEMARSLENFKDPLSERALADLIALYRSLELSPEPLVAKQAELADHLHPQMTQRHFLNFILPIERILDRALSDDEILITEKDQTPKEAHTRKRSLALVLDHLRSAFNVGSLYRMAETLQAEMICVCGYTPASESESVQKTAMGTAPLTETRRFEKVDGALAFLRESGYALVALETSPQSESIYHGALPDKCAFVVGNERFGLDYHTLKLCDQVRKIPLVGLKNSLNVASALSVACFEWHRQQLERE